MVGKKFISLLVAVFTVFTGVHQSSSQEKTDISVMVNGEMVQFDQKPIMDENNRVLVPIRFVSEALGATVVWYPQDNQVEITKQQIRIAVTIGQKYYTVNGITINGIYKEMDTAPVIINSRTLVSVRFISEALGATVAWDQESKTVLITTGENGNGTEVSSAGFERDDLDKIASTEWFEPKDGYLSFWTEENPEYKLSEEFNPFINTQVYELTKSLLDDRHYVLARYTGNAEIKFTQQQDYMNAVKAYDLFEFQFREREPFNLYDVYNGEVESFSKNAFMLLNLYDLTNNNLPPRTWDSPFYKEKLKDSLTAVFGDDPGNEIFQYIFDLYLDKRQKGTEAYNKVTKTERFGNIQVDFYNLPDFPALFFAFSYIEDNEE